MAHMRLLVSMLLLAAALGFAQQEKGARQAPKNLKVLKPDTDIRATMGAFRNALGVQCTYCHVMGDFASDDNPKKEVARHMITMVQDINGRFQDGKMHVTCYTCHRGATEPLTAPPAAAAPAAQ